ncbi:acyl-CoA dehydrogenase family protein [Saccharopolyspora shandongensis]|uniref:acyl-CoA dehydrogenase family protein n=1 Tax=Saccharopolyspora shandongensis TaxID=418495 RepID=UPI003426E564
MRDVASRALQVHGSLGVSNEMPFAGYVTQSFHMGLADGPTEVHKAALARQVLHDYEPSDDLFPTRHEPKLRDQARRKYADVLKRHGRLPA